MNEILTLTVSTIPQMPTTAAARASNAGSTSRHPLLGISACADPAEADPGAAPRTDPRPLTFHPVPDPTREDRLGCGSDALALGAVDVGDSAYSSLFVLDILWLRSESVVALDVSIRFRLWTSRERCLIPLRLLTADSVGRASDELQIWRP